MTTAAIARAMLEAGCTADIRNIQDRDADDFTKTERRNREIKPFQPHRDGTQDKPDDHRHEHGDQHGEQKRKVHLLG